jgi:hypothetical protein
MKSTGWLGPVSEAALGAPIPSMNTAIYDSKGGFSTDPKDERMLSTEGEEAIKAHTIPYLPPVQDQKALALGPAWAISVQLSTLENKTAANADPAFKADPNNIASARSLYSAMSNTASAKKIDCSGATMGHVYLSAIANAGTLSQADFPNMEAATDASSVNCDVAQINQAAASAGAGAALAKFKINGYRSVAMDMNHIKQELLFNNTVIFGANIKEDFFDYAGGVVTSNTLNGYKSTSKNYWHAMNIVGFDDGQQAFKVQNSWGTQWGEQGFAWIAYDLMLNQEKWIAANSLYVAYRDYSTTVLDSFKADLQLLMREFELPEIYVNPYNPLEASKTAREGYIRINLVADSSGTGQRIEISVPNTNTNTNTNTSSSPNTSSSTQYTPLETVAAAIFQVVRDIWL